MFALFYAAALRSACICCCGMEFSVTSIFVMVFFSIRIIADIGFKGKMDVKKFFVIFKQFFI